MKQAIRAKQAKRGTGSLPAIKGRIGGVLANHKTRRLTVEEIRGLTGTRFIDVLAALDELWLEGRAGRRSVKGAPGCYTWKIVQRSRYRQLRIPGFPKPVQVPKKGKKVAAVIN